MRLHAEHHQYNPLVRRARVSFNGRLLERVIMADEERGQVIVYEPVEGGILKKRLRGTVRIVDPLDWDVHSAYTRCDRD